MIKIWWILSVFFLSVNVFGQPVDSVAFYAVDSLIKTSRDFTSRGEFNQALDVNDKAENLALQAFGQMSAAYGSCLFNRGRVFHIKREYGEAEKWYLESQSIRGQVLGKEHPDYAWCLNNLAILYQNMGQYDKAEPLWQETTFIREKVLGKDHPDYDASLNNLAFLYYHLGQYEKHESLILELKAIREKTFGKAHPKYAAILHTLATFYTDFGQYDKAESFFLESKDIREKTLGKNNPEYAWSLNNLGILYQILGQYERAESFYLESKDIREKTLSKDHPDYASSLNNLALLYKDLGQYEKSEPLMLESRAIWEKTTGRLDPNYAFGMCNLGILYQILGQYDKAESFYLESKDIREKVLGKDHPDYATSLNNLALLYKDLGLYEKAEPLLLESTAIREKTTGKVDPLYAFNLYNLGLLYHKMGQNEKAESFYLESKDIREKVLGKDHPDYAASLSVLASVYSDLNQNEKSELLYLKSMAILEKALGKDHPNYSESQNNLIDLYNNLGQYEKSEPHCLELSTSTRQQMEKAMHHLSGRELDTYMNQFSFRHNDLLSFTQKTASTDLIPVCYNNSLFYKGFLLEAVSRVKQLALSDSVTIVKYHQLQGYQRRLATQYTKPMVERDSALVVQLESRSQDLEKELTREVAGYGDARRQVRWEEVQAALPVDGAALEFVHFSYRAPAGRDSILYAALLLRPGTNNPEFIPLFEEKELDQLVLTGIDHKADYVNELYAWSNRGLIEKRGEKSSLYDLIWKRIEESGLYGVKTIYYSPSGVLHRLNLGAIAVDAETTLSDHYQLVALNSTRQLVIPDKVQISGPDGFLMGGISFDADTTNIALISDSLMANRSIKAVWTVSGPRLGTWAPLAWTGQEVSKISSTLAAAGFKSITNSGSEATEEAIKAIGEEGSSPRVLHLATHGFFFPDPEVKRDGLGLSDSEPIFKRSNNPMIRSGLILAGGNYAWQHGHAVSPDKEDGILTAYEISQMNLSNTELVVLSACETGLGDIQGNEGVYGLQRAFKIAGAKYLIMSLWQVPDRETMEFMTTFYNNWLEEKLTIPDAFRKTQREMRDRFFNPYSWAGFVLVE